MAKETKVNDVEVKKTEPVKPALDCFGYVMFKHKGNNTWFTTRVNFDENLTVAEFEETIAAGDKQLAIEQMRILLGSKVF